MNILTIEKLTPAEVPKILELDRLCLGGIWSEEGYLREIDSPNSYLIALHVRDNQNSLSKIIGLGCVWAIVNEAHITLLGVDPEYRRRGLGELLLLNLLKSAIANKLEWATLEVNVNNFAALGLYKKFGFEAVGRRKGYYQQTGEDALILWRKGIQESKFKLNWLKWQQELEHRLQQNRYQYQLN